MKHTHNWRTFIFCPKCRYDVEEDEGYMEWKHWDFCPYCGSELVKVLIENRPAEFSEYAKSDGYVRMLELQERLRKIRKKNLHKKIEELRENDR